MNKNKSDVLRDADKNDILLGSLSNPEIISIVVQIIFIFLAGFTLSAIWLNSRQNLSAANDNSPWHSPWGSSAGPYIDKTVAKDKIMVLVLNGANLETIEHYFLKSKDVDINTPLQFARSQWDRSDYYSTETPLIEVLKDIEVDLFADQQSSSLDRSKIREITNEYNQRDPFESLPDSQKEMFSTLRRDLGDSYTKFEPTVLEISSELGKRNELVDDYLKDSQYSLNISIVSLIIGFVVPLISLISQLLAIILSHPSEELKLGMTSLLKTLFESE